MRELSTFSSHDGHIESVVIGIGQVKVSFQTWNCMKLVLVFYDVVKICSDAAMADIDDFLVTTVKIETENKLEEDFFFYTFQDSWDGRAVLCITAKSMEIYEVGCAESDNTALFNVGLDYLGGQHLGE